MNSHKKCYNCKYTLQNIVKLHLYQDLPLVTSGLFTTMYKPNMLNYCQLFKVALNHFFYGENKATSLKVDRETYNTDKEKLNMII